MKVSLTGIAGGSGLPTALALMARGHEVAVSVRSRTGGKTDIVATLEAEGARIVEMDVTDAAGTGAGVADAVAALGGLEVLFNNAEIGAYGIQELMSPEDMTRVFDVNVTGVLRVMRSALPHFRAQGRGTILLRPARSGASRRPSAEPVRLRNARWRPSSNATGPSCPVSASNPASSSRAPCPRRSSTAWSPRATPRARRNTAISPPSRPCRRRGWRRC
jgi:NAD(P)-dependent dehydrogenase (short-subunit alcohol dehydrogenase family)